MPHNRVGDYIHALLNFVQTHGRLPNNPLLLNDFLFRLKTSDEILDPLRVFVSDKEFVKLYVKAVAGDQYNVPTIAVLRSKEAVDDFAFPPDCCIKPTHASLRVILRQNGAPVDKEQVKSWFDVNIYRFSREANYKSLKPKVIVEPLLFGSTNVEDYKIFCFNGSPRLIQVDVDRFRNHTRKYFDTDWNELDFSIIYPRSDAPADRPRNLSEMLSVAARLSAAFSFVRIDLYSDGRTIYVGEITNCSENANGRFIPRSAEKAVSELIFRSPP